MKITKKLVSVPPNAVTLDISELKEGYPINITCSVSVARPPPKIEMFLGGKRIAEASQIEVFYHSSQFYRSYITLTSANRTWNNMILNCSVFFRTKNDAYMLWNSKAQKLNYKCKYLLDSSKGFPLKQMLGYFFMFYVFLYPNQMSLSYL